MAKPIIVIYPAFGSQTDADNGFAGFPKIDVVKKQLPNAVKDAEFPPADVSLKTWWVTQPELAAALSLGDTDGNLLPQLLFATPDPNGKAGELFVLAKLVKEQITRDNMAIMLKAVGRLKKKFDEGTGGQMFYDPTLQIPLPNIGFNPANAPGGWLIGFNDSTYNVELSRYGQMFDEFTDKFSKNWPLIALAIGGFILLTRKKNG